MAIPILDNKVVADSTLFSVVLTSTDPAVMLNQETVYVTIEDNDCELFSYRSVQDFTDQFLPYSVVTFGLNPVNYSVAEDAGSVSVTVSLLSGTLARGVSVVLVTSLNDGTAIGMTLFVPFMCFTVLEYNAHTISHYSSYSGLQLHK